MTDRRIVLSTPSMSPTETEILLGCWAGIKKPLDELGDEGDDALADKENRNSRDSDKLYKT